MELIKNPNQLQILYVSGLSLAFHSSFEKFHSSLELSEDANACMGLKIFFKIDIVGIRIKVLLDRN